MLCKKRAITETHADDQKDEKASKRAKRSAAELTSIIVGSMITEAREHVHWPMALFKREHLDKIATKACILRGFADGEHGDSEKALAFEECAREMDRRHRELEEACIGANREIEARYEERRERLHANSDEVRYYYLSWEGDQQKEWMHEARMPAMHVELVRPVLDRPALVEAAREWMRHQTASHALWDKKTRLAFADYCHRGYSRVWHAFNTNSLTESPEASTINDAFHEPWVVERTLPEDFLLFEGQGKHEDDVCTGNACMDIDRKHAKTSGIGYAERRVPFSFHRRRPTSCSWVPNVAVSFVGDVVADGLDPPMGKWTDHIEWCQSNKVPFRDWPCPQRAMYERGQYANVGCLLVYRVASPGVRAVLIQTMTGKFEEAEVILQPGLDIRVTRVERRVEMATRVLSRVGCAAPPVRCDILYADISVPSTTTPVD